jgi:hypothetical protein
VGEEGNEVDPASLLIAFIVLGMYCLPFIIAWARKSQQAVLITVLTVLLAWTGIGWLVLLVMAMASPRQRGAQTAPTSATLAGEIPAGAIPPVVSATAPAEAAGSVAPSGDALMPEELAHLNYARQFLLDSYRRTLIDHDTCALLLNELNRIQASRQRGAVAAAALAAVSAAPPAAPTVPAAPLSPPKEPVPIMTEAIEPPHHVSSPSRAPSLVDRVWQIVRSDFALHGLAYLGVLLTFTGALGFVLFAFNTVSVPLRATAGIAVPTVLFLTAWFLYRRASVLVGHSLETLAAAVTPVALFADLSLIVHGPLLTTLQVTVALLLMVAYWLFWRRRSASPLRFLLAGMFWTAAWASGFYFQSRYSAIQVALAAGAVLATVAVSQLRADHPLASATRAAAVPGAAAVYVLVILFAIFQAPALPLLVAAAALIITVEFLAAHSTRGLELSLIQPLLLGSLALGVGRLVDAAVIGPIVAIAFLALLEWQERRRPHHVGLALTGAGALSGLSLSLLNPWSSVVSWGLISAWMHWRRLRPTLSMEGLERSGAVPVIAGVAGLLPIAFGVGLMRALPVSWAVLAMALIAVVLLGAVRWFFPRDIFYAYWIPSAAGAVALTSIGATQPIDGERIAAVAILGVVLGFAPRWPVVRTWTAAAAFAWAALATFQLVQVPVEIRIITVAVAGLLLQGLAEIRRPTAAGHLAGVGLLLAFGAVLAAPPDWTRVIALSTWAAGVAIVTVANELGGSVLVALLARHARRIRLSAVVAALPAAVLAVTLPFLIVDLGGQLGILTAGRRSLSGVVLALTGLAYAGVTRRLQQRRLIAAVAATSGVLLSGVGIAVAAPELWPVIASVAASIAIVLVIGAELRRGFMTWFAWLMSLVLLLLLTHAAGVPTRSVHLVLIAAGALAVVGGLLYDDIAAGRRSPGDGLRLGWLMRPLTIGALSIPAGLAFTFQEGARSFGWWSMGAALAYLVIAFQLRAGSVSAVSYALAAFGVTVLLPWQPLQHPWQLVPVAFALIGISLAIARTQPKARDLISRWDLSPFVIAHLVGGVAIARAIAVGSVAPTWSAFGALCLLVAAWRRHWAWAAAGVGLLLVGAHAAGPGWLAVALLVTAAVAVIIASRSTGALRTAMQISSVIAIAWAWQSGLQWRGTSVDVSVAATALAFGAAWMFLAGLGRRWITADWMIAGGSQATGMVAAAAITGITVGQQRHPFALVVAAGFALHALGTALAAKRLRWPYLREIAAALATLAVGTALYDLQPSAIESGGALAIIGAIAVGTALVLARRRTGHAWIAPLLLLGGLHAAGAVGYAVAALPSRQLLIAILLLLAVETAALSLVLRRSEPLYAVPVLACAAWLAFATDALAGNPEWLTVPIGIAGLMVVELFRRDRRRAHLPPRTELLALEYGSMAFVLAASLVQTVSDTVAYGALAIALGVALATWGFFTRVRRRSEVGAGGVLLALVLMVAVPIVRVVPQFQGAVLWGALAAVGIVLLLLATTLEQGRARVQRTIRLFEDLMVGWE